MSWKLLFRHYNWLWKICDAIVQFPLAYDPSTTFLLARSIYSNELLKLRLKARSRCVDALSANSFLLSLLPSGRACFDLFHLPPDFIKLLSASNRGRNHRGRFKSLPKGGDTGKSVPTTTCHVLKSSTKNSTWADSVLQGCCSNFCCTVIFLKLLKITSSKNCLRNSFPKHYFYNKITFSTSPRLNKWVEPPLTMPRAWGLPVARKACSRGLENLFQFSSQSLHCYRQNWDAQTCTGKWIPRVTTSIAA